MAGQNVDGQKDAGTEFGGEETAQPGLKCYVGGEAPKIGRARIGDFCLGFAQTA